MADGPYKVVKSPTIQGVFNISGPGVDVNHSKTESVILQLVAENAYRAGLSASAERIKALEVALKGMMDLAETANEYSNEGGLLDERYDAARAALSGASKT